MDVWSQEEENAATSGTERDVAALSCSLLLPPAPYPGKREVPGAPPLFPANGKVPKECTDTKKLLMFRVLSFNRVGHESYCEPKPMNLHRFLTPC